MQEQTDILVIGAGAAGLMAAIAARGAVDDDGMAVAVAADAPRVVALDASPKLGLKILVSGGGRCNVSNERVDEHDFDTDAPHLLRGCLLGFDVDATRGFFESRGCPLYAEPLGKLFPRTDDADDILRVLVDAAVNAGVDIRSGADVVDLAPGANGQWEARMSGGETITAPRVIVATGGKSLPRTGSRGFGYDFAAQVGHAVIPPQPALTPILFHDDSPFAHLAGVTHPVVFKLVPRTIPIQQAAGRKFRPLARSAGSCVFTHDGASGPAALDISGSVARALLDQEEVVLRADVWSMTRQDGPYAEYLDFPKPPGACLPPGDAPRTPTFEEFIAEARKDAFAGNRQLENMFVGRVPKSVIETLLRAAHVDPARSAKAATARDWQLIHEALVWRDVQVTGVDGFGKAEVTCGGVPLGELRRGTLESRVAPGVFFCGEVVNVTGRLGGFNFQWAWASGFAAGNGARAR